MNRPATWTALALASLCLALPAHAKLFRNAYVSFELPPNWNCNLEGTEWVCVSQFSKKSKEAIIILTAKEVGPTDSLAAYTAHLQSQRTLPNMSGSPSQSRVLHTRQRRIANHTWVDGMQLGSEVSSYYTRYLATIKDRIAILVTFSAHKAHYTKYSNDFLKAIQSLRVVAPKDLIGGPPQLAAKGNQTIGAPIGSVLPSDMMAEQYPAEPTGGMGDMQSKLLALVLLLLAIGGYFFLKQKKKPAKASSRSKSSGSSSRSQKPR